MADKCHIYLLGLIILCSLLRVKEICVKYCKRDKCFCVYSWIHEGINMNDTERHERLNLGSDCSLNIYKTTKEDYGLYNCWQYVNVETPYTNDHVLLHILLLSPASTQGAVVAQYTLCIRGFKLVWVNESGVDLQTDSRYQISSSPEHCNITLTTTLLNEDNNREWRCQITEGTDVKTSVSYTVKYLVIIIIIEIAAVTTPTVIQIICERRAGSV
ncbi:uncharacterized protein LOC127413167 [Myxocyprinus asiaticus]|uniref:uncharacterized protein LOC127413167 n=1 Tax=Myxocyprinus asiaticus TaxID=70543 RepID=UPI002221576A|nr:uncharacterized protein LOC127413167 [Myxocyprinus asiaticus]